MPNSSANCDGSGWGSGTSLRLPSANQPMSTGARSSGFSGGTTKDEVSLSAKLPPGSVVGQIRRIEHALDPIEFASALGEHRAQAQPAQDGGEDVVVGSRLAQGLDALVLQRDHSMVDGSESVMAIPSGIRPFADVPAFQRRAGRQDDVGKLGLALHPDGLVDDELDALMPVSVDPASRSGYSAQRRSAVAVDHVDRRIARHRIRAPDIAVLCA